LLSNRYVYEQLKQQHPRLTIFASFTYTHLNGLDGAGEATQASGIRTMEPYLDLLGLSVYPCGWHMIAGESTRFRTTSSRNCCTESAISFSKPIGVTESGAPSKSFTALGRRYEFSGSYQREWVSTRLHLMPVRYATRYR
jgi:hypothetical protein